MVELKTYQEAVEKLSKLKHNEVVIDKVSNSVKMGYNEDDKRNIIPFIKTDAMEYPIIEEALDQYLELNAGPGAKQVWRFATTSPLRDREYETTRALEMIHKRVENTRKMTRLHSVDAEGKGSKIMGVTSDRHAKIYDLDLLSNMSSIMTPEKFGGGGFSNNVTHFDFDGGQFSAPDELPFKLQVRVENNQWGRHGLVIHPAIMRQICSNGACVQVQGTYFSVRHVGEVNMAYMDMAVRKIVANFDGIKQVVLKSFETTVDVEKSLARIVDKFQIGKKDIEVIQTKLSLEKRPNTLYGIANAVSAFANMKDGERRLELQAIAGKIYSGI